MDKRNWIKGELVRNSLTQTWLSNQVEASGIRCDGTELSLILNGRRRTPKAEEVLDGAIKIMEGYNAANRNGFISYSNSQSS